MKVTRKRLFVYRNLWQWLNEPYQTAASSDGTRGATGVDAGLSRLDSRMAKHDSKTWQTGGQSEPNLDSRAFARSVKPR